MVDESGVIPRK